jgi:para-nitrobenzyl esterase
MTAHEPARFVARHMTQHGNRVWLYRFSYVAASLRKQWTGAQHASEIPFLFQTLDARYGKDVTEKDRAAAHAINTYVANFVQSGNPNGADQRDNSGG